MLSCTQMLCSYALCMKISCYKKSHLLMSWITLCISYSMKEQWKNPSHWAWTVSIFSAQGIKYYSKYFICFWLCSKMILLFSLTSQDLALFRSNLIWLNPLEIIDVLWNRRQQLRRRASLRTALLLPIAEWKWQGVCWVEAAAPLLEKSLCLDIFMTFISTTLMCFRGSQISLLTSREAAEKRPITIFGF